jgi:hypothetical protein
MTTTTTTYSDEQKIASAAALLAGCIFEDAEGETLEANLEYCIAWKNKGSDGDLTQSDRDGLRLLLNAATGITSDLCDSDTSEVIRPATIAEACESATAGPEGHIAVDWRREGGWNGEDFRRCYVCL